MLQSAIVEAALTVHEALKRIPDDLKGNSFYGHLDLWQFIAVVDDVTCSDCMDKDTRFYYGNELRSTFQHHEIQDTNMILAKVHPNCRCMLLRIYEPSHYISVTKD